MEWVPMKDAKYCFLPECNYDSNTNPDITFVPIRSNLKQEWCRNVGRNVPKRVLYCCDNHLNLEKDLKNFMQWKHEGKKPKMSTTAVLRNVNMLCATPSTSTFIVDTQQDTLPKTSNDQPSEVSITVLHQDQPMKVHKVIQVKPKTRDQQTNFKARKPLKRCHTKIEDLVASSDTLIHESNSYEVPSSSGATATICSEKTNYGRSHILKMIEVNPKAYIGLPKNMFWVIDHIVKQYKVSKLFIMMTLFKLKQNDTLGRIKDEFQLSAATVQNNFYKTTIILASYFQNFIFWPDAVDIKKNLPFAFKIRYSTVQCIIDCFEIEIERPGNPTKQAQTWSQYKSCNTVKYLIGCTPNGLVNFVSRGYGGRISDKAIVEKSGFIDILPTNSVVMADRGFKEIQTVLKSKNVLLLRPPSVHANEKPTKKQVVETKVIASLRVHIERVIRRLREFRILKPHSVINHKHVKYLDKYVIIACGLINLQDHLIKTTN